MSKGKINNKSIARIAAIQVLYQLSSKEHTRGVDLLLGEIVEFYQCAELDFEPTEQVSQLKIRPNNNYLRDLVKFTHENLAQIDGLIADNLGADWQISSLPILLLATIRVGIGELLFFPETPPKVVINEFTDIASDLLDDNEIGFVNSLLDKIYKQRAS